MKWLKRLPRLKLGDLRLGGWAWHASVALRLSGRPLIITKLEA
jgi:hypothetical protein